MAIIHDFPDPLIDPREKGKDFILKYGKAMFYGFTRSGYKMFYNNRNEYRTNILYAMGDQSVDQYKKRLDCWEDQDKSLLNLDWSILNLCSKFVSVVQGRIRKQELNVIATAIDALAIDQRKEYRAKLDAYQELQAWMSALGVDASKKFGKDIPDIPMDAEEKDMFINMNTKHYWAMKMEIAVKAILKERDFDTIREEMIWDLIVLGVAVAKVTEKKAGPPDVEKVDPENFICSNAKDSRFRNMKHAGEVKLMTTNEFFKRAGSDFSDKEKEDILKKYTKRNLQSYSSQTDDAPIDMFEVLDFQFLSEDKIVYLKKKDKYGNGRLERQPHNFPREGKEKYEAKYAGERKVYSPTYDCKYKGLWIVGSDYICDFGKCESTRDHNMTDCKLDFIAVAPNMKKGKVASMVKQMTPVLNSAQLNWLKYNDAVAKAKPKGAYIDLDALENVALGKGGANLNPQQVLDIWEKKGYLVGRSRDTANKGANGIPIQELENGMAHDVERFLSNIVASMNILRDITGINEVTDASTPDPKLLKSVAEAAMQGTSNALDYLYSGDEAMFSNLCSNLSTAVIGSVRTGNTEWMVDSIGDEAIKFFGQNSEMDAHKYAFMIEPKPTKDDWNGLYAKAEQALANQQIDLSDLMFLYEIDNLKEGRQYLIVAEKRKAEDVQQKQLEMQDGAAQSNQKAAQQTIEMQKQLSDLEIQGKIALEQEKRTTALMIEAERRKTILLQTQMQVNAKVEEKEADIGVKVALQDHMVDHQKEVKAMEIDAKAKENNKSLKKV
jgi:hypothetical protein